MKHLVLISMFVMLTSLSSISNDENEKTYPSSTVSISNSVCDLYGTILLPLGVEKPPVVLLISGSGPTDRDGNQKGMTNNSLKFLAEGLAEKGIASLRFDKRGIGESKSEQLESELVFDDFITDAMLWVEMLKGDERFSKVYIAGHSEGSLIGMVAAKRKDVDGYISIAGSGKRIDKVILEQISGMPEMLLFESKAIIKSLLEDNTVSVVSPQLYGLFRPSAQPYMISWFKYEPVEIIAGLDFPILVLQGTTDIQVAVENAELLAKANPLAKLVVVEGMNHVLKMAELERSKNIEAYTNPDLPISDEIVGAIEKYIFDN
jgi:hypothetical protein